jgi:quercetin dioxygenase-like cupin family protein
MSPTKASPTKAESTSSGPSLLSREEGMNDIWWPYVPAPEVGRHTNKVLGEQTEGRLFQALVAYPRGAAPPLHIHHDADETFFVLDGEVTIFVGNQRNECTAGDFLLGPRGVPHAFLVRSEWAEMLVTFSPAGIDGFFAEVAPAVIAGDGPPAPSMPDQDEFIRLMAKYECEFVGPPPTLDDES